MELGVREKEESIFNFEQLEVYKKSLVFVNVVYDVTAKFPKEERFVLAEQFRRAAISIPLNIAEGCGQTKLQFKRYLNTAKGSIRECIAIITLSKMRRYISCKRKPICTIISIKFKTTMKLVTFTSSNG